MYIWFAFNLANTMGLPGVLFYLVVIIQLVDAEIIRLDMTHTTDNESIYWPNGQVSFSLDVVFRGDTDQGYFVFSDEFQSGTHVGTHMDAPIHFHEQGHAVDEIPLANLIAPAVAIDIRQRAASDPDVNITLDDVQSWETQHGRIPDKAVIFQCAGWSDRYPNKSAVFGNDRNDASDFHFPAFSLDAAEWLVTDRNIVGLGVDTPSADYGQSDQYPVHRYTAPRNVFHLENVKDTCELPPSGATVYVMPMKIAGASGAPVRILATWDTETNRASSISVGLFTIVTINVLCGLQF